MIGWIVDAALLRQLRQKRGWSLEELERKSGICDRTLRRIEGGTRIRRSTLEILAQTLGVPPTQLGTLESKPAIAVTSRRSAAVRVPASVVPAEAPTGAYSALETLVALERASEPVMAIEVRGESLAPLTAKAFQDAFATYLLDAGKRFAADVRVKRQRGTSPGEAAVLGARHGACARFEIEREVLPGRPMSITVFARDVTTCRLLQDCVATERVVRVAVRVVATSREGETVRVVGLTPDGHLVAVASTAFDGFSGWAVRMSHPWTFVVDAADVLPGERTAEAKSKRRGTGTEARGVAAKAVKKRGAARTR